MSENQYSWVGVYKQIAERLVEKWHDFTENGHDPDGFHSWLKERCGSENPNPFTFFERFTGIRGVGKEGKRSRKEKILEICKRLGIEEKINDIEFSGLEWQTTNTWLSNATKYLVDPNDISGLWDLATQSLRYGDVEFDRQNFEQILAKCLRIKDIGRANFTNGLYWLNPNVFIPLIPSVARFLVKYGLDAPCFDKVKNEFVAPVTNSEKEAFASEYCQFLLAIKNHAGIGVLPAFELVHQAVAMAKENKKESPSFDTDEQEPTMIKEIEEILAYKKQVILYGLRALAKHIGRINSSKKRKPITRKMSKGVLFTPSTDTSILSKG